MKKYIHIAYEAGVLSNTFIRDLHFFVDSFAYLFLIIVSIGIIVQAKGAVSIR